VPQLVWVAGKRVASLGLTVRDLDHADFENLIHDVLSDGAEGPWISKGATCQSAEGFTFRMRFNESQQCLMKFVARVDAAENRVEDRCSMIRRCLRRASNTLRD